MAEGITIRGIPEVQRNLANFPKLLGVSCLVKAAARAIAVFESELRARCPEAEEGATSDEEYGTLIENLTSTVTVDSQGQGVRASVGFGRKSMVSIWIEFGHRLVSHAGKELGFVAANPFMRQSFSVSADRATEVFIEEVKNFMDSAGSIAA